MGIAMVQAPRRTRATNITVRCMERVDERWASLDMWWYYTHPHIHKFHFIWVGISSRPNLD